MTDAPRSSSSSILRVSSATAVPIGLLAKVECVEPGGKIIRMDQRLPCPDAGERVETVRDGLPEHQNIRLHAEMLDRPHLAGAIEPHLYFIDHQQDAVLVQDLLQFAEEVHRRHDIAAGALDCLDIEGREFGL